ncbi:hypothetical protein Sango_1164400 [Sesamum angolense]|uniref:Reverse transcriptase Ty1/copia-type domain-containing protein n=1 Tax=Sesamum angolense TaxID=2727404 RepID=A0AAE1WVP8_9LAMI|nr:hypothetical protein Sango_1164400 [Sesamum angolense]
MQKNTAPPDPLTNFSNYAQFDDEFAGNTVIPTEIDENCWIVDSGASNHVCGNIALFHSYIKSASPHYIHLLDGSKRLVQYTGTVKLTSNSTLENVSFVPQFSVNLLSISQLCHQKRYQLLFTQNGCVLQDQDTKDSLVMGVLLRRLYIYKQDHRVPTFSHNSFHNVSCCIFSLDVHFYEGVFPYSSTQSDAPSLPMPTVTLQSDNMLDASSQPATLSEHDDLPASNPVHVPRVTDSINPEPPPLRRSQRQTHKPSWLNDFEPRTYLEAVKHVEWQDAMKARLNALERNLAKTVTVRLFLALAAAHGWPLQQVDVNNVFLHGHLDEDLYMTPPEGYAIAPGLVSPTVGLIQSVKDYLHSLFTIKDLGEARYFLGLEIVGSSDGLYVAQNKLIRRLSYLGFTRPDISHYIQQLSQFLTRPCEEHWRAVVHVVRYLKGTATKGLFLPSSSFFLLRAYCDADWAFCTDSRRLLTGFCIFLGDGLVSWKTKKQITMSRYTAEVEYRSMAATVRELRWISYILSDLGLTVMLPIQLFCDNQAALYIMARTTADFATNSTY